MVPQGFQNSERCCLDYWVIIRFTLQWSIRSSVLRPWNYPLILTLQALIGAIAAGCTAVVKPSEFVPNYSQLLADLLPKYLDKSAFSVVNGGIPEASRLLELQWDHSMWFMVYYHANH